MEVIHEISVFLLWPWLDDLSEAPYFWNLGQSQAATLLPKSKIYAFYLGVVLWEVSLSVSMDGSIELVDLFILHSLLSGLLVIDIGVLGWNWDLLSSWLTSYHCIIWSWLQFWLSWSSLWCWSGFCWFWCFCSGCCRKWNWQSCWNWLSCWHWLSCWNWLSCWDWISFSISFILGFLFRVNFSKIKVDSGDLLSIWEESFAILMDSSIEFIDVFGAVSWCTGCY